MSAPFIESREGPHASQRPLTRGAEEQDELASAVTRLKQVVDEMMHCPASDWVGPMGTELAAVDRALRCHVARAEGPDGLFEQVIQDRPTMVRRVAKLREDHCRLMVQSAGLRSMVRAYAISNAEMRVLMRELLIALRQHHEEETDAVFDSINLDIGAGD
jgi:hypothetical protein